jgi:anti-sigma-K factor RskA
MKLTGSVLEQLAGAYVLGTLSLQSRRRFAAIAARELDVRRACQRWENRLAGFGLVCMPIRPQDDTLEHILKRIQVAPRQPSVYRNRWLWAVVILAAAALALVYRQATRGN